MAQIFWSHDLSVGIDVLDRQHMRIVDYLNKLDYASKGDWKMIAEVIEETIDYTQSHFSFEEDLMEEAGYPFLRAHKKVHELFIKKVLGYKQRFELGENVTNELHDTLVRWLVNHIKGEDADYSEYMRKHFADRTAAGHTNTRQTSAKVESLGDKIRRFFGRG